MAGPKSFVERFDRSTFGQNVGGLGGGLMALGEILGATALGAANARPGESAGSGAARGLATGVLGLGDSFERNRMKRMDRDFRLHAREQLQRPDLGYRERQMWEGVLSGNQKYLAMLPSLWNAQINDRQVDAFEKRTAASERAAAAKAAAAGQPTADAIAKDEQTLIARQSIARMYANPDKDQVQKILESMGVEAKGALIESARRVLRTREDPNAQLWFEFASKANPLTQVEGLAMPTLMANGSYDFTADGVQGAAGAAPMSDPNPQPAADKEPGFFENLIETGKGLIGLGGSEAGDAREPDAVLKGLLDATDPEAMSAGAGATPQSGDTAATNTGNGGYVKPTAEEIEARVGPRAEDIEAAVGRNDGPPKDLWQVGRRLKYRMYNFVPGYSERITPEERGQFNEIVNSLDPKVSRTSLWDPVGSIDWGPMRTDPGVELGRRSRRDLLRGLGIGGR